MKGRKEIFSQINDLEGKLSYELPPQLFDGGYASLIAIYLYSIPQFLLLHVLLVVLDNTRKGLFSVLGHPLSSFDNTTDAIGPDLQFNLGMVVKETRGLYSQLDPMTGPGQFSIRVSSRPPETRIDEGKGGNLFPDQ
ncbi:hypothetical protein Pyn_02355 [Prunus yedoensis var. nudiflora]|uniref:Uncharacterized protein n=1 Tax=Prunus yedoensis var. nudiflora TaxID=2094558 RepID=A0A314YIR4_PRUYE|nr:hypothetical protein Pyn_02355 [Prunus yedoensis var. nudiflora]